MSRLTLTDTERLILANQYEILAAVKKDEAYARLAKQLRGGHEWLYQQSFDCVAPNMPEDKAQFVIKILEVFSSLRASYQKLDDKRGLEPHQVEFPGFDGNNEAELLAFSCALRESNRFIDIVPERGKISPVRTLDMYNCILHKWEALGQPHLTLRACFKSSHAIGTASS